MCLKRRLLLGPSAHRFYASVGVPKVGDAEREVLEMLVADLEKHASDKFTVTRDSGGSLTAISDAGQQFLVENFKDCSLKLCGLLGGCMVGWSVGWVALHTVMGLPHASLRRHTRGRDVDPYIQTSTVQEDFILLSPEDFTFVAGSAVFTFMEIGIHGEKSHMDLGNSVHAIHTPVPGFNIDGGIGGKGTLALLALWLGLEPYTHPCPGSQVEA